MSSPRLSEVRSNGPITFQLNDFVTSDHSNGLADVSTLSYHPIWFVLSMRAPSDSALVAVGDVVFFMSKCVSIACYSYIANVFWYPSSAWSAFVREKIDSLTHYALVLCSIRLC